MIQIPHNIGYGGHGYNKIVGNFSYSEKRAVIRKDASLKTLCPELRYIEDLTNCIFYETRSLNDVSTRLSNKHYPEPNQSNSVLTRFFKNIYSNIILAAMARPS